MKLLPGHPPLYHDLPDTFASTFGCAIHEAWGNDDQCPRVTTFWVRFPYIPDPASPPNPPYAPSSIIGVELTFGKDSERRWWVQPLTDLDFRTIHEWARRREATAA